MWSQIGFFGNLVTRDSYLVLCQVRAKVVLVACVSTSHFVAI
jgi:hypothetical protein